jgi:hypothetical protein
MRHALVRGHARRDADRRTAADRQSIRITRSASARLNSFCAPVDLHPWGRHRFAGTMGANALISQGVTTMRRTRMPRRRSTPGARVHAGRRRPEYHGPRLARLSP